jgi:hypothetical protein
MPDDENAYWKIPNENSRNEPMNAEKEKTTVTVKYHYSDKV